MQKAQQPTPIEIMGHRAGEQVRFLIGNSMEKSEAVALLKNTREAAPPLFTLHNRFFVATYSAATREDPVFDMVKKLHVVVEIKAMKYYALHEYFAKREEIPIIKVIKPHGLIPYWRQHKPISPALSLRYA